MSKEKDIVSYYIFQSLLLASSELGERVKYKQAWDFIKWNTNGRVVISKRAVEKFLEESDIDSRSKAKDFGGDERNGNMRCFVAEHPFPTNEYKDYLYEKLQDFIEKPEKLRENFLKINSKINFISYIWFEEDILLNSLGFKNKIPGGLEKKSDIGELVWSRYREAGICPIETNFDSKKNLFDYLKKSRNECRNSAEVVNEMRTADCPQE